MKQTPQQLGAFYADDIVLVDEQPQPYGRHMCEVYIGDHHYTTAVHASRKEAVQELIGYLDSVRKQIVKEIGKLKNIED